MFRSVVFLLLLGFLHGTPPRQSKVLWKCRSRKTDTASVLFLSDGTSACTATLIAPQYILTSASCLDTQGFQDLQYCFHGKCIYITIVSKIMHPNYEPKNFANPLSLHKRNYDIGVAKLSQHLPRIVPMPLPEDRSVRPTGRVILIGYHVFIENHQQYFSQKSVELPIIERDAFSSDKIVVANLQGINFAETTGGPLIYKGVLFGVRTMIPLQKNEKSYLVYTDVNYYRDFIEDSMKSLEKVKYLTH